MPTETNQLTPTDIVLTPSETVLLNAKKFANEKPVSKKQAIIVMLLLPVFAAGAAFWSFLYWETIQEIKQSQSWPTTNTGVVVLSEVIRVSEHDNYEFKIKYQYTNASGQLDSGNTVYSGHILSATSLDDVNELQQKYPVGKKVLVHYSPSNDQSLLETDIKKSVVIFFLLGVFICLMLLIGFVSQLKIFLKK